MILHITAGKKLNELLKKDKEQWIPFNEAMIKGSYKSTPLSKQFIAERAKVHNVSAKEYKENMSPFLESIKKLSTYEEIHLFFGSEPFCNENVKFILKILNTYKYKGIIKLYFVNEENGQILSTNIIQ